MYVLGSWDLDPEYVVIKPDGLAVKTLACCVSIGFRDSKSHGLIESFKIGGILLYGHPRNGLPNK